MCQLFNNCLTKFSSIQKYLVMVIRADWEREPNAQTVVSGAYSARSVVWEDHIMSNSYWIHFQAQATDSDISIRRICHCIRLHFDSFPILMWH